MFIATGVGPYSGQAVHFRIFAPEPKTYALNRYDFEAWRHWNILDAHLASHRYMLGDDYTLVDMAFWGWARAVPFVLGGFSGAEYDAWLIRINQGDQFGSGFVEVNPNSKIPALMDHSGSKPVRVFESGSILMYLAEKFGVLLPTEPAARAECLSWLFWQMGSAPYLGGGFGHFYAYAPTKIEYAINRFAMEVKRELDVLDKRLAESRYVGGDDYTIADIAIWPWYGGLVLGQLYDAAEFLQAHEYKHVLRWAEEMVKRPAVIRGRMVNRVMGPLASQLHERHDAGDFATRTQDKLEPSKE
jgi:GST-like protein